MEEMPQSRTVRRDDREGDEAGPPLRAHLFLILECNRPGAGGVRCALEGIDAVVIGRAARRSFSRDRRTLTVGVPDPLMSSTHARIVRALGGWMIRDEGSTNGTLCDGVSVVSKTLEDNELIELGATLFSVQSLPTPPDTPSLSSEAAAGDVPGMETLVPEYVRALAALRRIMGSTLPILLLGESGTGKEVLARATHLVSRRSGAFVPVNCGAIPEALVEGQLFGHARGAFSGAVRDEPGFVRTSDGGTLFLDEVGDLPSASQAALLRVLQESEVLSVGTTRPTKVDLRVVSATHRRIDNASKDADGFRRDMYARLAGYVHELLPLRERRLDLGLLIAAILPTLPAGKSTAITLTPELGRAFYLHDWPLNVRELHHALAAALVFGAGSGRLELAHVPDAIRRVVRRSLPPPASKGTEPEDPKDAELRRALQEALKTHAGNVSAVAREMGKTRMQIHRWMRRFGFDPEGHRKARE